MLELTPLQLSVLERLTTEGFQFVAFPLYANAVGVRKGNCAALLGPVERGGMTFAAEPCFLVDGNLSVRVSRGGRQWFVWKLKQVEVTSERRAELQRFAAELRVLLGMKAQ